MGSIGPAFVAIVMGVIGLAIVAVLVSQKASTSSVIQAGGSALSGIIGAAVGPVSGSGQNQFGAASGIGGVTQ
jgi:hypothetical protein